MKKEFYRKNLPHLQIQGQIFFVTWLLANTLSNRTIVELRENFSKVKSTIKGNPDPFKENIRRAYHNYFLKFDEKIHRLQSGSQLLKNDALAQKVVDSIHYWDKKRIDLYCYCIMSNHVHAVFTVFEKDENGNQLYLQDIMKSIKNFSATECNKLLHKKGRFWHNESYDRLIRDRDELYKTICYVLDNPIKAGLCKERIEWKWSYINPDYNEFM